MNPPSPSIIKNRQVENMKNRALSWYKPIDPWLFILPTLLGLIVFRLGPIISALFISFTNWDILKKADFIGVSNYSEMFNNPAFFKVLWNTIGFSFIYVVGVMVFGLMLAVLLNQKLKGIKFFRSAFYTPVITSAVAVGIIWLWILSPKYGILTILLKNIGIKSPYWIGDPKVALFTVSIIQVWKMSGYYMILFLAGLQLIPVSLKEAAIIDGANKVQAFFKITIPLLSPTIFFVLSVSIIDSFRNFELIYSMTRGGPQNSTNTLVYDVYLNAFVYYRMGYASSLAYILLGIVAVITILNFQMKKRWVQYQY